MNLYGEGELGNVKPEVLKLGPVTADLIERVKRLETARCHPRVDHPPKIEQVEMDPFTIQQKLQEIGLIPGNNQEKWAPGKLVNVRGEKPLTCLLLISIDVGQLPPTKAEAFVERMMDNWKPAIDRLPETVGVLYQPVRLRENAGVQVIPIPS